MRVLPTLSLLAGLLVTGQASAKCHDLPWKFGMTPSEVSGIAECGPYKAFKNGDLETYSGVFNGKTENFQFFFQDGKLRRIGIYLYEGKDIQAAAQEWAELARVLNRDFGAVETAGMIPSGDPAFVATALKIVNASGKTQMAPIKQPNDAFIFSSFLRQGVGNEALYDVILYFNAPQ